MSLLAGSVIAKFQADLAGLKSGISDAQGALSGLKEKAQSMGESIKSSFDGFMTAAKIAGAAVVGALALIGKQAISSAADMEQAKIAFTTMFGSAEKAAKLMKEISDFAIKTPFELPQLVEGAKKLSAYGIAAEEMIPTLKMLGDITAGVGTDKMPQLILAFGQVKAATRLTGMELRQFTETGVPMLETLANYYNSTGKAISVGMGGAAKKTKVDVGELNDKLAIASQRLKEAEGNAKTKQSTLMSLRNTVENYKEKIAGATTATKGFSGSMVKAKVTAADVKDMIEDGKVSFQDVQAALKTMTSEGGKFFNLMDAQSKTFGGVMSNIRDQIGRTLRTMVGMDDYGNIAENSIFAKVKYIAEQFLNWLTANTPAFTQAFNNVVNSINGFFTSQPVVDIFNALVAALTALGGWVSANKELVISFIQGLAIAIGGLLVIGTIIGLFNLMTNPITLIILAIAALYTAWNTNFLGLKDITAFVFAIIMDIVNWFVGLWQANWGNIQLIFQTVIGFIQAKANEFKAFWAVWGDYITAVARTMWEIIKGVFQLAITLIIGIVTAFIALITGDWKALGESLKNTATSMWNIVVNTFVNAKNAIGDAMRALYDIVVGKLQEIWNKAQEIGGKIKDALSQISPYHHNSPSLIDYVQMGTGVIADTYRGLEDTLRGMDFKSHLMTMVDGMQFSPNVEMAGARVINQNITANLNDGLDVQTLAEQLAFKYRNENI